MLTAGWGRVGRWGCWKATTPGGNNGPIVEVTSLEDAGPGTLRAALSGNNRRVVFRVGGTIPLQSPLELRGKSFLTIDGSTAPTPGIPLKGQGLYIRNSHDIIVTHLRIRDSVADGITLWDDSYNVVLDHCSVTNSGDGNVDITENTTNVTVSWCLLGDTRSDALTRKTKGLLIANFTKPPVTQVSMHHNLFINEHQRSPQISTAGLFDVRNNVIRNWGEYGMRLRNGAWGNIINNVFATANNPQNALILEADAGPLYIQGNIGPGALRVDALSTAATPFPAASVTTDPVAEVERKVQEGAGAWPRDAIDTSLAGPSTGPGDRTAPSPPVPRRPEVGR